MANTGINPRTVISPQSNWQLVDVLYECDDWSMALGRWKSDEDGSWRPVLAQRWNGWNGTKGNPVSRGFPTWFILPDDTYDIYIGTHSSFPDKGPFLSQEKLSRARELFEMPKLTL